MLRYLTAGESHGEALTIIIEGMPSNVPLPIEKINFWLAQRMTGYGRGGRMKIEKDEVKVTAGIRNGVTLGSPIALTIFNRDWINWERVMHAYRVEPKYLRSARITRPRPGHADLAGGLKYNHKDLRNILERASARETASRTAAGAAALTFLEYFNIKFTCHVVEIGNLKLTQRRLKIEEIKRKAERSLVRCVDKNLSERMIRKIDEAKKNGDSLGGRFEVRISGLPPGLGSHVQWDRKIDGILARALMSIQSVKAVEIGLGVDYAHHFGSEVHDQIYYQDGKYFHRTNNSGGIEGGMTNGEDVILTASMKPIPTLFKPLQSVDMETKQAFKARYERSDTCSVPAAAVVGQCVSAFEIANVFLEKFGGDSLEEVKRNYDGYLKYLKSR